MVKPERLIYLPCESYRERWSEVVSGPDGMFERRLKHSGIPFAVYRPDEELKTIKSGAVMDTVERCRWGFRQALQVVSGIEKGFIQPGRDVIYWEDFWAPGIEMIPYCQSLKFGSSPKNWVPMYAFCHAQSVDPNDFTAPMAWWMRRFEKGIANVLSGIFTAAPELCKMLWEGHVVECDGYDEEGKPKTKATAVGTVFDATVLETIKPYSSDKYEVPTVVFSSRWDREKDPNFFMSLADQVLQERKYIRFIVCTGHSELRSNDKELVQRAESLVGKYPHRFVIAPGLDKDGYYGILNASHCQFNCALQDFVSYTLLEATYYGAAPLYPRRLTFPAALHHNAKHLYDPGNLQDAKDKLYALLDSPPATYEFVYRKYEDSVQRMLQVMGFGVPPVESLKTVLKYERELSSL